MRLARRESKGGRRSNSFNLAAAVLGFAHSICLCDALSLRLSSSPALPKARYGAAGIVSYYCLEERRSTARCAVEVENEEPSHRAFSFPTCSGASSAALGNDDVTVRIRERPFGEAGFSGSVWGASIGLASWVVRNPDLFAGKRVLELGAGCGLSGLACRRGTDAISVTLTDFEAEDEAERLQRSTVIPRQSLPNLRFNAELNGLRVQVLDEFGCLKAEGAHADGQGCNGEVIVAALDWHSCVKAVFTPAEGSLYDIILAADCIYALEDVEPLSAALQKHLAPGGTAYLMSSSGRKGLSALMEKLGRQGEVSEEVELDARGYGVKSFLLCQYRNRAPL